MQTVTVRRAHVLVGSLTLLSLPAFGAGGVGESMRALLGDVDPSAPYLTGASPLLLYVWMPLTVLGALTLTLAPGLLLALALGRGRTVAEWLLAGFALSLVVVSATAAAAQAVLGSLTGPTFVVLALVLTVVAANVLGRAVGAGATLPWPLPERRPLRPLCEAAGAPLLFLVVLTPKFFWEAFNGDGAHAYEASRLLLHQAVPFWPPAAGHISSYPGLNTMLFEYPASWFLRLFGEVEAAARLPLVLFLPLLHAAVVAVCEGAGRASLGGRDRAFVWAGIAGFGLVLSYSATYDPYCADIALPAPQAMLVMVCFLAAVAALERRSVGWTLTWTLFALLTSPAGLLQCAALLLGIAVSAWPPPWRRVLGLGAALAGCVAVLAIVPDLLAAVDAAQPGREHDAGSLVTKFHYVALADFERIGWAVLPCGIYPFAGLCAWPRADATTRALIVAAAFIFAMYYAMGFVSLHYFVPAMVLPLAVFWRLHRSASWGPAATALCTACVAVSLWMALPASGAIHVASRTVGKSLDVRSLPGYDEMDPAYFAALEHLNALFPADHHIDVPEHAYGGSTLAWSYYAQRRTAADAPPAYALAADDAHLPPGRQRLEGDEAAAVYVLDRPTWERHRTMKPLTSVGKPAFQVSRDVLFRRKPAFSRPGFIRARERLKQALGMDDQ